MWAQALILFNVLGTPLSHSPSLQHHFTTLYPTHTLLSLALIPSLQLACLLATPLPIGYLYRRTLSCQRVTWGFKIILGVAMLLAISCHFALYATRSYTAVMLLQGPVLGLALGTCFTISSLVLAGHYRNDVPLVSVQSGFAGFAGAVVYAIVARSVFQGDGNGNSKGVVHLYSGAVTGATLLAAFVLLVRLEPQKNMVWTERWPLRLCMPRSLFDDVTRGGGLWFILGYMLVFSGILVYPVYSTVLLTQPPGLFFPDTASFGVLAMLGVAAISASVTANIRVLKRVGAVNMFAAVAVLGGAVCLAPVLHMRLLVVLSLAALYGVALGTVFSLHMIVAAVFLSKKVNGR
jgi:hypothetical protein